MFDDRMSQTRHFVFSFNGVISLRAEQGNYSIGANTNPDELISRNQFSQYRDDSPKRILIELQSKLIEEKFLTKGYYIFLEKALLFLLWF